MALGTPSSNTAVPEVQLEVVDFQELQSGNLDEIRKLVRVSSSTGLFFLNLKGVGSCDALANMHTIVSAQRQFFARDDATKLSFSDCSPDHGYDAFEELSVQRLKLSQREECKGALVLPPDLQNIRTELQSIVQLTDRVLRDVAAVLCATLEPQISPDGIGLMDSTNPGRSNVCLGIATAPPGIQIMPEHLDEDILTLTYYTSPFLEVLDPMSRKWGRVEVRQDMPIVNVGESFQDVSQGRLRAPLHRVRQCPGDIDLVMYDLYLGDSRSQLAN